MKRCFAYIPVILAVLTGCSSKSDPERDNPKGEVEVQARAEQMPEQDDSPMEGMPDDDQGIIQI